MHSSVYVDYTITKVVSLVVTPAIVYNVRYRITIPPQDDADTLQNNKYLKKAMEKGVRGMAAVPLNYMNILSFMEKDTGLSHDEYCGCPVVDEDDERRRMEA